MPTMDTIALKHNKKIGRPLGPHDGCHGYHERSRDEFGLQMDSTDALSHGLVMHRSVGNCLKRGSLGVVARDGVEPPTPAFSGPPTD